MIPKPDAAFPLPTTWESAAGPHRLGRRDLLAALLAVPFLACKAGCTSDRTPAPEPPVVPPPDLTLTPLTGDALLDELERRAFDFFWEKADATTGLSLDRATAPYFASIAATGFGLSAACLGAERGFVTREQARARVLAAVRFFRDAPQGPEAAGKAGHKGFFYHFLDTRSGARFGTCELSTVDTALLLMGMLHAQAWFDGADADETEIRTAVDEIYARVDWPWFQARPPVLAIGWSPEQGFFPYDWVGYTEGSFLYVVACGSPNPTFALDHAAWDGWCSTYLTSSVSGWVTHYGQTYLRFPPLFGHQFLHSWLDMRGIADPFMRDKGIDYFENSRRATLAQRGYAIANPWRWAGYGENVWGITAGDGPASLQRSFNGMPRQYRSYAGRGMGGPAEYDDGTIAPYAAGSSLPFAPEVVLPALEHMYRQYGKGIFGQYGFVAFNQSFPWTDVPLSYGRVIPGFGWVDADWIGIEAGPLLLQIDNHRGERVWSKTRLQPAFVRGLTRAGFTGGWLG